MSFSELKGKDVVNICDGRKLGKPIDLLLNDSACVQALVVPGRSGGLLTGWGSLNGLERLNCS